MKVTVELSEQEVIEKAKEVVISRIAEDIYGEYKRGAYCYKNAIKECVREVIKKDIDNLSERAVQAASVSIENRAVKKLMNKLLEEK